MEIKIDPSAGEGIVNERDVPLYDGMPRSVVPPAYTVLFDESKPEPYAITLVPGKPDDGESEMSVGFLELL